MTYSVYHYRTGGAVGDVAEVAAYDAVNVVIDLEVLTYRLAREGLDGSVGVVNRELDIRVNSHELNALGVDVEILELVAVGIIYGADLSTVKEGSGESELLVLLVLEEACEDSACFLTVYDSVNVSMLQQNKIHPRLAFTSSGLFTDPESAYQLSKEYSEEQEQKALDMMAAQSATADEEDEPKDDE